MSDPRSRASREIRGRRPHRDTSRMPDGPALAGVEREPEARAHRYRAFDHACVRALQRTDDLAEVQLSAQSFFGSSRAEFGATVRTCSTISRCRPPAADAISQLLDAADLRGDPHPADGRGSPCDFARDARPGAGRAAAGADAAGGAFRAPRPRLFHLRPRRAADHLHGTSRCEVVGARAFGPRAGRGSAISTGAWPASPHRPARPQGSAASNPRVSSEDPVSISTARRYSAFRPRPVHRSRSAGSRRVAECRGSTPRRATGVGGADCETSPSTGIDRIGAQEVLAHWPRPSSPKTLGPGSWRKHGAAGSLSNSARRLRRRDGAPWYTHAWSLSRDIDYSSSLCRRYRLSARPRAPKR